MSTSLGAFGSSTTLQTNSSFDRMLAEKFEARIARLERVGLQLFGVANCFVTFGRVVGRSGGGEHTITEIEAVFCDELPLSENFVVISDLSEDEEMRNHRCVVGDPFIRFFASYPLYSHDHHLVGCIRLIDYQPKKLTEQQTLLLADFATIVERELALDVIYQNQVELIKQNRYLKRESLIDPLLGTWNKPAIVRSLRIEIERCQKAAKPLSLLFLLPDQIADLRNIYGVVAADQILIKMVSRVRSCVRPFDALGRFGNDQLLIVLPGASGLVATAVAERVRLAIMTHPEWLDNVETKVTVCAGFVSTDAFPDADPESLLSLAEKALLSAKNAGNNSVVQAKPGQPDMVI